MIIANTSKAAIVKALAKVNEEFDGNICFRKFECLNNAGDRFSVRLTVKDSSGPGTKFSPTQTRKDGSPRRIAAACWHVHGEFMDALNADAVITTLGMKIRPGDRWNDWKVGSMFRPARASECCDC